VLLATAVAGGIVRDHCSGATCWGSAGAADTARSAGPERPMTSTNLFRGESSMNRLRLFVCCVVAAGLGVRRMRPSPSPYPITRTSPGSMPCRIPCSRFPGYRHPHECELRDADFRSAQFFPINIEPGARMCACSSAARIDSIAKKVVLDTTYTFVDGEPYSFYVTGKARAAVHSRCVR